MKRATGLLFAELGIALWGCGSSIEVHREGAGGKTSTESTTASNASASTRAAGGEEPAPTECGALPQPVHACILGPDAATFEVDSQLPISVDVLGRVASIGVEAPNCFGNPVNTLGTVPLAASSPPASAVWLQIEQSAGGAYTVGLHLPGLPADAFTAGDELRLTWEVDYAFYTEGAFTLSASMRLARGTALMIALAQNTNPDGLVITYAHESCSDNWNGCGTTWHALHVATPRDARVVPPAESMRIGGLWITNGYARSTRALPGSRCDWDGEFDFVVGAVMSQAR